MNLPSVSARCVGRLARRKHADGRRQYDPHTPAAAAWPEQAMDAGAASTEA